MSAPQEIFETKLTRTEVLDLILDDLTSELDAQISPLLEEQTKLEKLKPSLADFLELMPKDAKVEVCGGRYSDTKVFSVSINFGLKPSAVPEAWAKRCSRLREIDKQLQELRGQLRNLTENRRRAQNEIIRRSLEATADGRRVLETVGTFKLALKQRLLPKGAV